MRGRITLVVSIWFYTIFTNPTLAEVCDKVRPDWVPSIGPSSIWSLIDWSIFILLIVFMIYSWRKNSIFLSILIFFSTQLYALYFALMVFPSNTYLNIYYSAIQEGCLKDPVIPIITSVLLSFSSIILCGLIFLRKRKLV